MRRPTICLAFTAALALPAGAAGAIKTYGGKTDKGGKIGLDADISGGKPTEVVEMRVKNFPANCSVTGPSVLSGPTSFTGLTVTDNEFGIDDTDPGGSRVVLNGRFKRHAKVVEGQVKLIAEFDSTPGPEQTCTTRKRDYSAERGAPAPNLKTGIASAFRIG